jgi:RNA polymerase sigma factor (sigma-70 family)
MDGVFVGGRLFGVGGSRGAAHVGFAGGSREVRGRPLRPFPAARSVPKASKTLALGKTTSKRDFDGLSCIHWGGSETLVRIVKRVEERAVSEDYLGELYEAHALRAFRFAYILAGTREVADDLVQDAFLRAFDRLGALRERGAFPGYLRTTILNAARGHFRRQRIERPSSRQVPEARSIRLRSGPWDRRATSGTRPPAAVPSARCEGIRLFPQTDRQSRCSSSWERPRARKKSRLVNPSSGLQARTFARRSISSISMWGQFISRMRRCAIRAGTS